MGQKKFNEAEMVLAGLIVAPEALAKLVGDLIAAIPAVGQIAFALIEAYTCIAWAIILCWFTFKLGLFGATGLILSVGGILEMFGIPGGLATSVAVAIVITNNPRLAAAAQKVQAVESLGGSEALEKGAEAATKGAAQETAGAVAQGAAQETAQAAGTAAKTAEGAAAAEGEAAAAAGAREGGAGAKSEVAPEALGQPRDIIGQEGQLNKELFEQIPGERSLQNSSQEAALPPQDEKWAKVQELAKKVDNIQGKFGGSAQGGQGGEIGAEDENSSGAPNAGLAKAA